jgi:formate-dependent nitrite reductase cytochrome c552 subunit
LLCCAPLAALAADALGAESCQSCHPEAYAAWKGSAHARAKDPLSPQQQKDARCLSCHSPQQQEGLAQVSCESCHGNGQHYVAHYVMKDPELARLVGLQDPGEKSCRNCHDATSPSLKPFDFKEALRRIDHWTLARAKKRASAAR